MTSPRILVAGVGNIFLGDDAFGVEVVARLAQRRLPASVQIADFGIRGFDLVCALLDDYDLVILVDAAPRGGPPGTLYVVETETADTIEAIEPTIDPHDMNPEKVLRLAVAMGSNVQRVLLVGCEPTPPGADEEMSLEMSAPVRSAIDEAATLVQDLVNRQLAGQSSNEPAELTEPSTHSTRVERESL